MLPTHQCFISLKVYVSIKILTSAHLKGTIDYFVKEFFGKERTIRLRPAHFQFTEPSFEIDVSCGICLGKGEVGGKKCRVCKSGWLELAGAGMVHPNVLKMGGIDPKVYTGWAFGFGPERCMMMREEMKIDDIGFYTMVILDFRTVLHIYYAKLHIKNE
jgi:phenylalanyl-tRNA synthetase alpha chain